MKPYLYILFFLSFILNIYYIVDDLNNNKEKKRLENFFGGEINNQSNYAICFENFKKQLETIRANTSEKKYYYINVWNTICKPCLKEMPLLDSVSAILNAKVTFVFISDNQNEIANSCLKRLKYKFSNFVFLNEMNEFISSICNKEKLEVKTYPLHLIVDQFGKQYYFSIGSFENTDSLNKMITVIKTLK